MARQRQRFTSYRWFLLPLLMLLAAALSGCSYLGLTIRKAHWGITYKVIPSMSALSNLDPEDSLIVGGLLDNPWKREEPLLLVAVSNRYKPNEIVAVVQLQKPAEYYMAYLPRGDYQLFIFSDLDNNGDFESNEVVGSAPVSVAPEHSIAGAIVEGPRITLDFEHPASVDFHMSETVRPTSYVYASLDDSFFDPKYGALGAYNPTELISHTQGFVFGLEDYDPRKTMVLFLHGAGGTPRDWKFIVDGLDRSRFQPFFFYYPTGLSLDKLGTLLAQTLRAADTYSGDRPLRIVLAAHSMGGLVVSSAIEKLSEGNFPSSLKMYCSFSTPYGGSESARYWEGKAPVMMPAWRDIATESAFLQKLARHPWPKKIPFYLFFTYNVVSASNSGENSDGTVTIHSQLEPWAQSAATKVLGFDETHMGILTSEAARTAFLQLLDTVEPPHARMNGHRLRPKVHDESSPRLKSSGAAPLQSRNAYSTDGTRER